jgi:membrane-bound ClpP family serine protease
MQLGLGHWALGLGPWQFGCRSTNARFSMYWVWAILLLVLGLGLAVMEVFLPSAGILAFLSAAAVLAAIIVAFQQGPAAGFAILAVAMFGLPALVVLSFRYWPRTAMGRRVMLPVPSSEEVLPNETGRRHLKSLVGRVGRAKCKMLPGGVVSVDGCNVEAISEGVPVEMGQAVRVIAIRGNRAVVRLVEDEVPSETAADPLQRPIESVAPDPFDEPPA